MSNYTVVEFSNGEYGVKRISDGLFLNLQTSKFGYISYYESKHYCNSKEVCLDHIGYVQDNDLKFKVVREGVEND